jgi:Lrp/AsnC family leucine-responsive transcriptional regulator
MSLLDELLERLIEFSDTNTMMILASPVVREMPVNIEKMVISEEY